MILNLKEFDTSGQVVFIRIMVSKLTHKPNDSSG